MGDVLFPDDLAVALPGLVFQKRTSFYGDSVQEGASGAEYRVNRYVAPKYRFEYELRFARVNKGEMAALSDHFTNHGGRRDSFLIDDPVDGVQRRVRFSDPELDVERIVSGVYSCTFELVTANALADEAAGPFDSGGLY